MSEEQSLFDRTISQLKHVVKDEIKKRNTIRYSEFQQFIPLYKNNGVKLLGENNYHRLCQEFESRFSIFDPIYVISDMPDKNGNHKVSTIPSILNRVPTFNELDKANITDMFKVAVDKSDNNPLSPMIDKVTNDMKHLISTSVNEADAEQENYNKLSDEFYDVKEDKQKVKSGKMRWEEL